MNNPARDVLKEITRAADFGFDFLDLTLEPPIARADRVDARRIRAALEVKELGVVGHTAYYLPFGSAFDAVRAGAITEAERCLEVFALVGVTLMNVHLDCRVPGHDPAFINRQNIESLEALLPTAERLGITLMVENVEGDDAESLAPVLDFLPAVGLHLDIGHANIGSGRKSSTATLLAKYGGRLKHVHLSDNKGKSDDHLAIGAGTIDWRRELRAVKATGYDATFTLETFYGDSALVTYSLNRVRELWASL
ncbi:MAG: sugar phosphate isomerase/epimerase [Cytophagales bacterium]|nr:sugar phosphate isomerase/epimerase [Armatimonadota bacterium]